MSEIKINKLAKLIEIFDEMSANLNLGRLSNAEKEFKKLIGVPIDIRSAEKLVRIRSTGDGTDVEYILNEMDEHSDWTARNPL